MSILSQLTVWALSYQSPVSKGVTIGLRWSPSVGHHTERRCIMVAVNPNETGITHYGVTEDLSYFQVILMRKLQNY